MSLTKPFINTIVAFDATNGTTQSVVNILGGDAITSYTYQVFLQSTDTVVYTNTISVGDLVTTDIRTYNIDIPATILTNNNTYYIQVYTSNSIANSAVEISAPFDCYITPSLTLQWGNNEVVSGTIFNASNIKVALLFNANDDNSIAKINSAKINVYGINANYVKISAFESEYLYGYDLTTTLKNLVRTNGDNPTYIYYDIEIIGETIDGFVFERTISGIKNEYAEEEAGIFTARNDCANGVVKVSFAPSSPSISQDIFTTIECMLVDDDNKEIVYCIGRLANQSTTLCFSILNTDSKTFTQPVSIETIDGHGGLNRGGMVGMVQDDSGVYFAGNPSGGGIVVGRYDKTTQTFNHIFTKNSGSLVVQNVELGTFRGIAMYDNTLSFIHSNGGWWLRYNNGTFETTAFPSEYSENNYSITNDLGHIFIGLSGRIYEWYFDGNEHSILYSTVENMGNIKAIDCDDSFVYCGDNTGRYVVYSRSTHNQVGDAQRLLDDVLEIIEYGNYVYIHSSYYLLINEKQNNVLIKSLTIGNRFKSMFVNDEYVYCAQSEPNPQISPNPVIFKIYVMSREQWVSTLNLSRVPVDNIIATAQDDDFVYMVSGGSTSGQMCIYNKRNGDFINTITIPISDIDAIAEHGNYVYIGGGGSEVVTNVLCIYDKSLKTTTIYQSTDIPMPTVAYGMGRINSFAIYNDYVYISGMSGFSIYNTITKEFRQTGIYYTGLFTDIVVDDNYIFLASYDAFIGTTATISKWDKASLNMISSITIPSKFVSLWQDNEKVYIVEREEYTITPSSYHFIIVDKETMDYTSIEAPFEMKIINVFNDLIYCWRYGNFAYTGKKLSIYNKHTQTFSTPIEVPLPDSIVGALVNDEYIYITTAKDSGSGVSYITIFDKQSNKFLSALYSSLYRREGNDEWALLQSNISYNDFIFYDTTCRNNTLYEYKLIQEGQSSGLVCSCVSRFNKSYICDGQTMYDISNEYALGDVQTVQKTVIYEPYGAKYPTVAYNAETLYRQGALTAVLLAPTSQQSTSAYIDRVAQVNLVKEFNNWLSNKRAKIIKDINGNMRLVAIYDNISNGYYKELGNAIASTAFNWVEVGDFSGEDLLRLGIANTFKIVYN